MRKLLIAAFLVVVSVSTALAQNTAPTVIKLDQVEGKFEKEGLKLKPGKYIFEVTNKGVDRELGLVIVPVTNGKEGDHIKSGYLAKTIKSGETSKSGVVELKAGETYNYFCPLNPTPHYKIIVEK